MKLMKSCLYKTNEQMITPVGIKDKEKGILNMYGSADECINKSGMVMY